MSITSDAMNSFSFSNISIDNFDSFINEFSDSEMEQVPNSKDDSLDWLWNPQIDHVQDNYDSDSAILNLDQKVKDSWMDAFPSNPNSQSGTDDDQEANPNLQSDYDKQEGGNTGKFTDLQISALQELLPLLSNVPNIFELANKKDKSALKSLLKHHALGSDIARVGRNLFKSLSNHRKDLIKQYPKDYARYLRISASLFTVYRTEYAKKYGRGKYIPALRSLLLLTAHDPHILHLGTFPMLSWSTISHHEKANHTSVLDRQEFTKYLKKYKKSKELVEKGLNLYYFFMKNEHKAQEAYPQEYNKYWVISQSFAWFVREHESERVQEDKKDKKILQVIPPLDELLKLTVKDPHILKLANSTERVNRVALFEGLLKHPDGRNIARVGRNLYAFFDKNKKSDYEKESKQYFTISLSLRAMRDQFIKLDKRLSSGTIRL